jgi:hypothetical protein
LLAALAEGKLVDAPVPSIDRLEKLADRAHNQLYAKFLYLTRHCAPRTVELAASCLAKSPGVVGFRACG